MGHVETSFRSHGSKNLIPVSPFFFVLKQSHIAVGKVSPAVVVMLLNLATIPLPEVVQ